MSTRVPRLSVLLLVLASAFAIAVFVYLMSAFGGPAVRFEQPYRVDVTVGDSEGLAKRSDVRIRGVKVGIVSKLDTRRRPGRAPERTRLMLEIDRDQAPVRRDALVRVGQKTLLGEAYVDLQPGARQAKAIPDGGALAASRDVPAVEIDEALEALDAPARENLRGLLRTTARGARSPATSQRLSDTLAELDGLTGNLRDLGVELRGQSRNFAGGVQDTRLVLRELGDREVAVRSIVSNGNRTLRAVNSRDRSLQAGLRELPRFLATGRRTLRNARPLVAEARPLVRQLTTAAPSLTPAIEDLGPAARDADTLLTGLPELRRATLPFVDEALPVIDQARPAVKQLEPALANVVPIAKYFSDQRQSLLAWFSNTNGIGDHGDAKGDWARFFLFIEPNTLLGTKSSLPANSYAGPGDHVANKPYVKGSYPRLMPLQTR